MRLLALAAVLLVLGLPTVMSASAYERDGIVGRGVFALYAADRYAVEAEAGETIAATLTWADPNAALALRFRQPSASCPIVDASAPTCIANAATSTPPCSNVGEGGLTSPQTYAIVAPSTGAFELAVKTNIAANGVPYHLSIVVGGGGSDRVDHLGGGIAQGFDGDIMQCALLGI